MEEGTALVLALQLVALAAIAAALLLYLLCRLRRARPPVGLLAAGPGAGRAVLVTSADSALGLQLALHLAQRGFRVFAGLREPEGGGAAARALRAWHKAQEGLALAGGLAAAAATEGAAEAGGVAAAEAQAALSAIRLDVTREDLLHEAAGAVRSRLPAGQDGLWAVVNTAGCCARGRLEAQDSAVWEQLLRVNVVGALRAARALCPLLRSQKGRLLLLGGAEGAAGAGGRGGAGLVAFGAARAAVDGLATALRPEAAAHGVRVVALRPAHALADALFRPPRWREQAQGDAAGAPHVEEGAPTLQALDFQVLPEAALRAVEDALLAERPKDTYALPAPAPVAAPRLRLAVAACPLRAALVAACARHRAKPRPDAAHAAAASA